MILCMAKDYVSLSIHRFFLLFPLQPVLDDGDVMLGVIGERHVTRLIVKQKIYAFLQTFCRNVCILRRNALFLERNFHLEQVTHCAFSLPRDGAEGNR